MSEVAYAQSGDVNIAYEVTGSGPIDVVFVSGWISHLELAWDDPDFARFLRRLGSFSRLIRFDKRGTGLSDRVAGMPTLEQRMDDVRAVMDAVGSERAVLFGISDGGAMSFLFAATYPDRALKLVTYGSLAKNTRTPDYPWAQFPADPEEREQFFAAVMGRWGSADASKAIAPSRADDEEFGQRYGMYLRQGASPGAALQMFRMNAEIDVRDVLSAIHIPTLIMHRTDDSFVPVASSRDLASRIPVARYVELPGRDHLFYIGDYDTILDEIEEFITGEQRVEDADRVLATILFTDIVGSTEHLARLGDRRWREVLEDHYRLARRELGRHRGREIKTTGDGLLATFDGPARAVRCAAAIRDRVRPLGVEVRAGLHTGEVELLDQDVGGIAVHIGARVAATADASEVLVSSTVKDLVAGSGLQFEERGAHALKGVPGAWTLFAVTSA
jgi:pimeloyl-ACP methyl ester carboxylesterase